MVEFEIGEYDVIVDLVRKEIEIRNATYKYVDLTFVEFNELLKKIKEIMEVKKEDEF